MADYHAMLGGQGLVLDLQSYKRRVAPAWVAKGAAGDRQYSDAAFYQTWLTDDWSGGDLAFAGRREHDPEHPSRYRSGRGADGYSIPGALRNGLALAESFDEVSVGGIAAMIVYQGSLYLARAGSGSVYEYPPGGAYASSLAAGGSRVMTCLAIWQGLLFAANATDGNVYSFDGTSWTSPAFTAASGVDAMVAFGASNPSLQVGQRGTARADLRAWNGATLGASQYTIQEPRISAMANYDAELWLFGADVASVTGTIYRSNAGSELIVAPLPDNYVTSVLHWQGELWLGMGARGELWRFDGTSLTQVAAGLSDDPLAGLAVWKNALWVACRDSTVIVLRRYDGNGNWSEAIAGGSASMTEVGPLCLFGADSGGPTLNVGGAGGGDDLIHQAQEGTLQTSTTVELGLFDAGLPSLDKAFRSVTVTFEALPASTSIELRYRLEDSGSWTSLGTASADGDTSETFSFSGTVTGKALALRAILTGTSSASPVLYSLGLRYALQPETKREWEFAVLTEGTAELPLVTTDQTASSETGEQIADDLWTLKATLGTLTFVDLDDTSYAVWLLELQDEIADRSQRRGYSYRTRVRLLEA